MFLYTLWRLTPSASVTIPGPSVPGGGSGKEERDVKLGKMEELVGILDNIVREVVDL